MSEVPLFTVSYERGTPVSYERGTPISYERGTPVNATPPRRVGNSSPPPAGTVPRMPAEFRRMSAPLPYWIL